MTNTSTTPVEEMAGGWLEVRALNQRSTDRQSHILLAVQILLGYWARLACRRAFLPTVPSPSRYWAASVMEWTSRVLSLAEEAEPGMAPDARRWVEYAGGWQHPAHTPKLKRMRLSWDGTWTAGRFVDVELILDEYEEPWAVRLSWCSGTGSRSSFLDIEGLLDTLHNADVAVGTCRGMSAEDVKAEVFYE